MARSVSTRDIDKKQNADKDIDSPDDGQALAECWGGRIEAIPAVRERRYCVL